ncbi:hypothetical protein EJ04DRAFT_576318 [Polyplosphaeria fusca]|uniref:Mediator of RNA polymerase II transcription subunit 16 n=1 Tax=Polyplosphaeria fusca TaxID=682080 RepID=A0A9P4V3D9_9PLEO|nr:hypothetical protein EJ04DRAFT_576318 [Polyplosphaeria fusca]
MPLIMDDQAYPMDNMDNIDNMEDLFGDSEQVALPTIAAPPVKGLVRRLDELSTSGCSQKIAWSKSGCVASITADGYGVILKVFRRDPATRKWHLGKDVALEIPRRQDDSPFVHLSWSHLGNDLVVMDAAGRAMIFSCSMALDRMTFMRVEITQSEAEMDAVVGMHWLAILPYEQKATSGKDDDWKFQIHSHIFKDAHHPAEGKASLLYLKRHGELRLRFQQADSSWHEVVAMLGPMVSTREPFTHAAFASNNDNTLLLAAFDVSGRLHLSRVEIKWNVPQKREQGQKYFDKPELHVADLDVLDNCYPTSPADLNATSESRIRLAAQLTHLNFLPSTPEQNDGSVPTIQAIFSAPPNIVSYDQTPQQNPFSIVLKWEVHHTQQNQLHSSLDKVTSKKKSVSSVPARDVFLVKRLADLMVHSVIISCYPLWYNMILTFCYSDGTIEFRKRSTMDVISPDYNTDTVTSLSQAGFTFPTLDPTLHVALSPNHCIAACMQQDGSIKLRQMEYAHGSLASTDGDPRHAAAFAALVLQSSTAANQYFSSDDILSIIGPLPESRKREFISLMFQGLNVNVDCAWDEGSQNHFVLLGRSPTFVKTLSVAHVLGLEGAVTRSTSSKIAWLVLNIKYVTQIVTTITRMHNPIDKQPLRPEIVPQFMGICRWIMHCMSYLLDEIITLGHALRNIPQPALDRPTLESKIHELAKPGIILLLSGFPRMMMKLWAGPLAWVYKTASQYGTPTSDPNLRRAYGPLHAAIADVPFDYRLFEALLGEAHALVKASYSRASFDEAARNAVERQLLLGHVPEVLVPAARKLLGDTLFRDDGVMDKLDFTRLTFFETSWLGMGGGWQGVRYYDTHVVDVCQKTVVRGPGAVVAGGNVAGARQRAESGEREKEEGGGKRKERQQMLRQCTRCGAYMEDVVQGMQGYSSHHVSWLMGVAKHCVCGNGWMLADDEKRVKFEKRARE